MRALLILLVIGACDNPNVGAVCKGYGAVDCDDELTCAGLPGGGVAFCTKTCSAPGLESECPEGAICDVETEKRCLKICNVDDDCNPYHWCRDVRGSSLKACDWMPFFDREADGS